MTTTMSKKLAGDLLTVAKAYVTAKGGTLGTLALVAHGNSRFFARLEAGESFEVRKYDEVMGYMAAHWPDSVPWPEDVPRPTQAAIYETMSNKLAKAKAPRSASA